MRAIRFNRVAILKAAKIANAIKAHVSTDTWAFLSFEQTAALEALKKNAIYSRRQIKELQR